MVANSGVLNYFVYLHQEFLLLTCRDCLHPISCGLGLIICLSRIDIYTKQQNSWYVILFAVTVLVISIIRQASSLPPIVTSNPTAGFPVLLQLLQTHGQFDRLTRTKTVESLLTAMDLSGVERYIQHLIELAQKPDTQTDDE